MDRGDRVLSLIRDLLSARPESSLLDIGCGTVYFTRQFAAELRGEVVGIDPDKEALEFARSHAVRGERYHEGKAEVLPFAGGSAIGMLNGIPPTK